MSTTAFSSQGSKLQVSISSVFTEITQAKGIKGLGIQWDIKDITVLSSPSNFKEKMPIMKDGQPVQFQLIWDPANATHEFLRASNMAATPTLESFKWIMSDPGNATYSFSAYVTKFEPSTSQGEVGMVDVELTPSGAITYAP